MIEVEGSPTEGLVEYEFKASTKWIALSTEQQFEQYKAVLIDLSTNGPFSCISDRCRIGCSCTHAIFRGATTKEVMTRTAMFFETMWDTIGGYPDHV